MKLKELLGVEIKRIDGDIKAESQRLSEQMNIRAEHSIQLGVAEAKRIDAIRAVDVNAVSVANERATAQAAVLANQVAASAETLRSLVAATANTQAQQLVQLTTQLTDRLTALEKSQYENKGSSGGMRDMYGWIFGAIIGFAGIASIVFSLMHH